MEAVAYLVPLLDGWRLNAFACRVPAFAFGVDGNASFLARAYNRLAETAVRHVPGGELEKILVVEFLLLFFFTNLSPVNNLTVHRCFCLILDGREIKIHADCTVITI
jgi:hypothetical protein